MERKIGEELYKKILQSVPICCVDLVILNQNKVLLIKRKEDPLKCEWCTPGGRVYKNEKLEEAALRKALEETNLKVKIIKNLGAHEFFSNKSRFDGVESTHAISNVFLVEPLPRQEVRLDSTSSDFKWIDKIDESLPEFVKGILEDSRIFK